MWGKNINPIVPSNIIAGTKEYNKTVIFVFPRKICIIQIILYNIALPKSGWRTNNKTSKPKLKIEKTGTILFVLDDDKKWAFIIIKNGFISSDGCSANNPKFIHLWEPFTEPPINKTTQSNNKQKT